MEVLNPVDPYQDQLKAVSSGAEADSEESEEPIIEDSMNPTDLGKKFGEIKVGDLKRSMDFIEDHPEIVADRNQDGLMVQAFNAQMEGKDSLAKQYVHQALLIQYVKQVGRSGVKTFFAGYCSVDLADSELRIVIIRRIKFSMTTSIPLTAESAFVQGRSFKRKDLAILVELSKFNFKLSIPTLRFISMSPPLTLTIQRSRRPARYLNHSHRACNVLLRGGLSKISMSFSGKWQSTKLKKSSKN